MIRSIRPRLVTFDVTGTLLMTKLEHHYAEIGSQHGLTVDKRKLARSFNANIKKLSVEHPIYGKHSGLGWENWWREIVYKVFKDQHENIPQATLDKVADSLIKCYGTSMCWSTYPGTMELLEYLREKGLILGVISNFDERLEPILFDTRLRQHFSFVITSYNLGIEKPDSLIFEEALKLTKHHHGLLVKPEEAVHIGDTVDSDYVGARSAEWNAFLINRDNRPVDESKVPETHIFQNLQDLRAHFSTWLK